MSNSTNAQGAKTSQGFSDPMDEISFLMLVEEAAANGYTADALHLLAEGMGRASKWVDAAYVSPADLVRSVVEFAISEDHVGWADRILSSGLPTPRRVGELAAIVDRVLGVCEDGEVAEEIAEYDSLGWLVSDEMAKRGGSG